MIVARSEPTRTITELVSTPEERAKALAEVAEFKKNVAWFGNHAKEIRDAHSGKFICVVAQELFVGDDPVEVIARAKAARPALTGGFFSMRLSTHRGPKIYAHRR